MSTQELGPPAYKKYDIEAWISRNQFYGEVSEKPILNESMFLIKGYIIFIMSDNGLSNQWKSRTVSKIKL